MGGEHSNMMYILSSYGVKLIVFIFTAVLVTPLFVFAQAPPQSVVLSADQSSGPVPLTVNFTATLYNFLSCGNTYTWNFGDGVSSALAESCAGPITIVSSRTLTNSYYTYKNGGTFTATLTVGNITSNSLVITVQPPLAKFSLNDRVQTIADLNVRATPSTSGTFLGKQPTGALGTVIGGPVFADGYTWWNINYDTGADGWSIENYLVKTVISCVLCDAPPTGCSYIGGSCQTCGTLSCIQVPTIISLQPTSGKVDSNVTITGSGFTATGNKIKFGDLGSEGNPSYSLNSSDGKTLVFTVPSSNYLSCWTATPACLAPAYLTQPGIYEVSVINANGTSKSVNFTVTAPSSQSILLSADQSSGPVPLTVNFTATLYNLPSCGRDFSWDFGDGTGQGLSDLCGGTVAIPPSQTITQTHKYANPGTYAASVTVNHTQSNIVTISVAKPGFVVITSISPSSGPTGTQVTIIGSGFSLNVDNRVNIGSVAGKGTITGLKSPDGVTLQFTMPSELIPYCPPPIICSVIIAPVVPGVYNVDVVSPLVSEKGEAQSNSLSFTVPLSPSIVYTRLELPRSFLGLGSSGDDVRALQEFLAQDPTLYTEKLITGFFGSLTARAVQRFQERYDIASQGNLGYGFMGPRTLAKLKELQQGQFASTSGLTTSQTNPTVEELTIQIRTLQIQLLQLQIKLFQERLSQPAQ